MVIDVYPATARCPGCHRAVAPKVLAYYEGTCGCVSGAIAPVPVWRRDDTRPCQCNAETGQPCLYHAGAGALAAVQRALGEG